MRTVCLWMFGGVPGPAASFYLFFFRGWGVFVYMFFSLVGCLSFSLTEGVVVKGIISSSTYSIA